MIKKTILIVEDDAILRDTLKYNIELEGYNVLTAGDGGEAIDQARKGYPDIVLLDLMLPVLDGFEVCRIIRRELDIPIIILTARVSEIDKVVGLEMGADDYVTKPFSMRELNARIKAVLRRSWETRESGKGNNRIGDFMEAADIKVDTLRHMVFRRGTPVDLNPKEFELLVYLLSNRGRVISREQALRKVWGLEYLGNERTVDVHIRWLRQKLEEDAEHPQHLITIRGYGYKFVA